MHGDAVQGGTLRGAGSRDHAVAAWVARRVGVELLAVRRRLVEGGTDPASMRAEGDRAAHEVLVRLLHDLCPGDPVLSEEGTDCDSRLGAPRVWVVDPLDGSLEFAQSGRVDWAVHVALVEHGAPVVGAVALPAKGTVFATGVTRPVPPLHRPLRLVVSPTRPPANAPALAEHLGAELVAMGSAGAKAMAVVDGEAAAYVHSGGQYEWDSAAPVAVAVSAGLHASRIDGSPLVYNRPDPYLPDVVICHPGLADQVLAAVAICR